MFDLTNPEILFVSRVLTRASAGGADVDHLASVRRKAQRHLNSLTTEDLERLAKAYERDGADPLALALERKREAKRLLDEKLAAGELDTAPKNGAPVDETAEEAPAP